MPGGTRVKLLDDTPVSAKAASVPAAVLRVSPEMVLPSRSHISCLSQPWQRELSGKGALPAIT